MFTSIIFIILFIFLLITGLYMVTIYQNYVRRIVGVNIMQYGIFLLYLGIGFIDNGFMPIISDMKNVNAAEYVDPLPQVLMLTAIVVGFSVSAVGLTFGCMIARLEREGHD